MSDFRFEHEMAKPVSKYLRHRGFRFQGEEVNFYEYRIDLYAFSRVEDSSIAVELKLMNWRRALTQSLIYQLCADYVYAALPKAAIGDTMLQAFRDSGLGVIAVTKSRCIQILQPMPSLEVRSSYRGALVKHLTADRNAFRRPKVGDPARLPC